MTLQHVAGPPDLVKYRLVSEIGHGGMATVYRATDLRLGREVAVKLVHPHLRENREVAARFIAEARAVAKLKHPGIVEIFDVSDEKDTERFLVAELVRGPSLRTLLAEHPHLPAEIGACIVLLLCEALAHAHDAGIVHRDVKPENVLLDVQDAREQAQVKLTDFGIAKILDAQGVTCTGQVLGSPAHMAPEQIEGGQVDARTDIFSVGVLLYECMVGHLPFEGKNPAQVLRRVLDCTYSAADRERPSVGARWAAVIAKAMAREQSERFETVRQLTDVIKSELAEAGIDAPREEIFRYLKDPSGYVAAFVPRMIKLLVARAERARAQRDVPAAAGDLNRAVAYAPDDPDLLRQVQSLARGSRHRRIMRQAALVAATFAIVGGSAFGVARVLRQRSIEPVAPEPVVALEPVTSVIESTSVPPPVAVPVVSAPPPVSAEPEPTRVAPVFSMTTRPPAITPLPREREVIITAFPQSAAVSINGSAPVRVDWELKRRLPVGEHAFTFSLDDPCCEGVSKVARVVEAKDSEGPQRIHARLKFRDATVALAGGPTDATLWCPEIPATLATGSSIRVPMNDYDRFIQTCFFQSAGAAPKATSVRLKAGILNTVRWPQ